MRSARISVWDRAAPIGHGATKHCGSSPKRPAAVHFFRKSWKILKPDFKASGKKCVLSTHSSTRQLTRRETDCSAPIALFPTTKRTELRCGKAITLLVLANPKGL